MGTPADKFDGPTETGLTFEAALLELQQIVDRLEDGGTGLEAGLAEFERGIGLLRECYRRLDAAEQRIEQLVKIGDNGEIVVTEFDGTATAGQSAGKRRSTRKTSEGSINPRGGNGNQLDFDE